MPRRELRSVRTGRAIGGAVVLGDDGVHRFTEGGGRFLTPLIKRLGEGAAARQVYEQGASNGYWYFFPVPPAEPLP